MNNDITNETESNLLNMHQEDAKLAPAPPKDPEKIPMKAVARRKPSGRGRPRKKPKEAPMRPLSGYNFFFREQRNLIIQEREADPEKKKVSLFATLGKEIASRWKALDAQGRAKYEALADEDLARYREEMNEYNELLAERTKLETARLQAQKKLEQEQLKQTTQSEPTAAAASAITNPGPSIADSARQLNLQLQAAQMQGGGFAQPQVYTLGPQPSFFLQQPQHQQGATEEYLARASNQMLMNQLLRRQQMQQQIGGGAFYMPQQQQLFYAPSSIQSIVLPLQQQGQAPTTLSDMQLRLLLEEQKRNS